MRSGRCFPTRRPGQPGWGNRSTRSSTGSTGNFEWKQAPEPGRGGTTGSILPTLLFLVSGCIFLVLLWRLWQLHEPRAAPGGERSASVGEVARMAGLEAGSSLEGLDPWSEATRRRAAGDLAGAVIWLFLDQLLSLQRAGTDPRDPGEDGSPVRACPRRSTASRGPERNPGRIRRGLLRPPLARPRDPGPALVPGRGVPRPRRNAGEGLVR